MGLGILTEAVHERIIADLDRISAQAGILKPFIYNSAHDHCTAEEIGAFNFVMTHPNPGMVYDSVDNVEWRMMALGGICIRNYIDARMMTMHRAMERHKDGMEGPTVLLIPNFFVGAQGKGDLPAWEVQLITDLLYDRHTKGLKTVVYVAGMKELASGYGRQIHDHITQHYIVAS